MAALKVKRSALLGSLLLLLLFPSLSWSQSSYLSQKVQITAQGQPLGLCLEQIAAQGGFQFSYPSGLIPEDSLINYQSQKQPIKKVLEDLLGEEIVAVEIGRHLVLQSRGRQAEAPPTPCFLNGTLWESPRLRKLPGVSVYENGKKRSVLSDASGNYRIELPGDREAVAVSFSLKGFHDTVLVVKPQPELSLDVMLRRDLPLPESVQPQAVTGVEIRPVEDLSLVKVLVPEEQRRLSLNRLLSLRNIPVQVSFIPSLGTNRLFSGSMTNHFSLNVLAGYSNEVKGLEVGGLFNIARGSIHGAQIGGMANVVGGRVRGLQVGGLYNVTRGSILGVQVAGIHNSAMDSLQGVQVAGISNLNHGVVQGLQIAGLTNFASEDVLGLQIAGLYNECEQNVEWLQLAGVYNRAKGDVNGSQIAGVLNRAEKVGGVQIGLVNVADSVGGASIGLFSWVKKGYRSLGLQANEIIPLAMEFRTGTEHLYNIIGAGWLPDGWAYGYGLGTIMGKKERLKGYLEGQGWQLMPGGRANGALNLLASVRGGLLFRSQHLEAGLGPAFRYLISTWRDEDGQLQNPYGESLALWQGDSRGVRSRIWIGGEIFVRLGRW